jgi:hypothetical protein
MAGIIAADTGDDLTALLSDTASAAGVPLAVLVGLGIAESELCVRSERWGRRSPRAKELLAVGDRAGLEELVRAIDAETPGDISFGLFQQTVRWADEGDHTLALENVFALRDLYFQPGHAARVAARKLAAFARVHDDPLEVLCRYNKPALPGVDNPHRARYQESLEKARSLVTSSPAPTPRPPDLQLVWEERLTDNSERGRPSTRGVVVHSTRGGTGNLATEYAATMNWFRNPAAEVSAHVVVGADRVGRCVPDDDIAWHAGENNRTHLGIEIAQSRITDAFTDFQYRASAAVVRQWCDKYGIPMEHVASQNAPGLIGHEEAEQGRRNGKSDPGPKFDWDRFMALVRGDAAAPPPPPPPPTSIGAFLAAHPEAGTPRHEETRDLFDNGYVWLTPTTRYRRGALVVWRKWLNRAKLVSWEAGEPLETGSLEEFLARHPGVGPARHAPATDVLQNRFVWTSRSDQFPKGALVVWRAWLNATRVVGWED